MTGRTGRRPETTAEWLGDGRYRITGVVPLSAPPGTVRAWLTEPVLMRRWILGGRGLRTDGHGLYVFTVSMNSMRLTMYGEALPGDPHVVRRHYREVRPGEPRATGAAAHERTVTYTLTPTGDQSVVHCEVVVRLSRLGRWGGVHVGRAEARSLSHSLHRLSRLVAGGPPHPWSVLVSVLPLETPCPL